MTCCSTATFATARVEVVGDYHGLYRGFAENSVGL
jgi:hypothetical protein